jgi:hypothetical protein
VQTCAEVAAGVAVGTFIGTPSPEVAARAAAAYASISPSFFGCLKTGGVAIVGINLAFPVTSEWHWSGGGD